MCITEYNEEATLIAFKEEGRQEGEIKGRREGEIKGRREGEIKGRQEGEIKGRKLEAATQLVARVHRAMHKQHMDLEQACDYEDVTMEDYYNAVKFKQNV